MPRLRLGVVLLLPSPVREEVNGLRRALGDGALGRIPPHLTLVPPVNVREEELGTAVALLREAAGDGAPMRLELGPVATFLPDTPVVYLEVRNSPGDALARLRSHLDQAPLRRETSRPFVPHVTLCDDADPARIPGALSALSRYRAEVEVAAVNLLTEGSDRIWRPLADARLSGVAVIGRGGLPLELSTSTCLDAEARAWAAGAWAAYSRDVYGESWLPDRPLAIVARREGGVVGVADGSIRGGGGPRPVLELSRLIVGAAARSQGVGSHLLAAVVSYAAESGCAVVRLRTAVGSPAERFYRDRGFVVTAGLPAWREGQDFVVMERAVA